MESNVQPGIYIGSWLKRENPSSDKKRTTFETYAKHWPKGDDYLEFYKDSGKIFNPPDDISYGDAVKLNKEFIAEAVKNRKTALLVTPPNLYITPSPNNEIQYAVFEIFWLLNNKYEMKWTKEDKILLSPTPETPKIPILTDLEYPDIEPPTKEIIKKFIDLNTKPQEVKEVKATSTIKWTRK
jgi:hypothetical protein